MTPAAMKRLRMGLLLGSVAVVGLVLWLASGYGLGHDTYIAPDRRFQFEHPSGYTARYADLLDADGKGASVTVQGTATIRAFTLVRKTDWAKSIPAEQRWTASAAYLEQFLAEFSPQILRQVELTRPAGRVHRLDAVAHFDNRTIAAGLEAIVHGDDLFLVSIEGESEAIFTDPEGDRFFNSIRLE